MASVRSPERLSSSLVFSNAIPRPALSTDCTGRASPLGIPMLQTLKQNWFSNLRGDLLAGLVVALALIPEAIAFSIIAGVDPKIGLYASFSMAVAWPSYPNSPMSAGRSTR